MAFNWFTYLVNQVSRKTEMYSLNLSTIIDKIIRKPLSCIDLSISVMGHCHLIKIMSFSKLVYLLHAIPFLLSHSNITTLNSCWFYLEGQKTLDCKIFKPGVAPQFLNTFASTCQLLKCVLILNICIKDCDPCTVIVLYFTVINLCTKYLYCCGLQPKVKQYVKR